ncbi:MAG TPA: hypothetical protein P5114_08720, partial [Hyphomicrobiaceae bacterium]|nr:hypothetical protein [Hyphomicrobiaceae bacterium]
MFPRVLSICVSLCAVLISTKLHATEQKDAEQKLYCIVLANQKNRTDDFHYYMRSCPAGGGACFSKREPHVLRNKGGPSTQGTVWCSVQRSPIEFELTFDESDQPGYQERLDVLKPQTFAWRGLVPNIWCVGNAWFHFTSKRSGAGVAPGYPHKTQRGRCEWEEATYGSVSSAETGLPQSVVGSWVPKGTECPGFFDNGSRGGKVLWVQPHAIERSEGACRLTGRFNLGSSFTARALCAAGNRYGNTEFTFDRIDDETMRLREGRGRRVTYKRCQRNWLVDPEQWNAVEKLKGQTLSFVLDIEAEMRGVESKKTVDGSHTRKIELQVNDDGTLTDRMQIGDSAEPKIFKARLGEIAVDSDGDRATWLVEDGRLKRMRERKGYYEILSWPLNFDS